MLFMLGSRAPDDEMKLLLLLGVNRNRHRHHAVIEHSHAHALLFAEYLPAVPTLAAIIYQGSLGGQKDDTLLHGMPGTMYQKLQLMETR